MNCCELRLWSLTNFLLVFLIGFELFVRFLLCRECLKSAVAVVLLFTSCFARKNRPTAILYSAVKGKYG